MPRCNWVDGLGGLRWPRWTWDEFGGQGWLGKNWIDLGRVGIFWEDPTQLGINWNESVDGWEISH